KVIVPLAGKGTRLLPLTKRVPKPLVRVAGRPVMDYVMDAVKGLDVEELIVITGHLKESVERYILEHYDVPAKFVEQKKLDGTAGAINLARPHVDAPVLIIFVDTVFEADLTLINRVRSEEHTSELQSRGHLVCRLLLEKKNNARKSVSHEIAV